MSLEWTSYGMGITLRGVETGKAGGIILTTTGGCREMQWAEGPQMPGSSLRLRNEVSVYTTVSA